MSADEDDYAFMDLPLTADDHIEIVADALEDAAEVLEDGDLYRLISTVRERLLAIEKKLEPEIRRDRWWDI